MFIVVKQLVEGKHLTNILNTDNVERIVDGAEKPNGTLIIKFVSGGDIEVVSDIRITNDGEGIFVKE